MERQTNIFDMLHHKFKFNKKRITMFEAFAGMGSQHMSFKKNVEGLGTLEEQFNFKIDVVGISEIDKHAITSYNAIHGDTKNYGSITDIKQLPNDIDIFTYSFPCQDISLAGKGKGLSKGDNTRSGLLWEVERLLKCSQKPKLLLMENVKALINENHRPNFVKWINELERLGYSNYWEVLNAKDYGIPQNRERVFMVSILGEWNYNFPLPIKLDLRLKDMLQDNHKGKYNLSEKTLKTLKKHNNKIINNKTPDISSTIHAGYYKMGGRDQQYIKVPEKYYLNDKQINQIRKWNAQQDPLANMEKVYKKQICPTILARGQEDMHSGLILIKEATKKGYAIGNDIRVFVKERIRKLTPLETHRLMGFTDETHALRKKAGVSDSQCYKQDGNSIVVDVLYYIFKEVFK